MYVRCDIASPAANANRISIIQLYARARRFVISSSRNHFLDLLVAASVSHYDSK